MRRLISAFMLAGLMAVPVMSGAADLEARKQAAREAAAEITLMRSERAGAMAASHAEITPEVFKSTCGAVAMRAKEIAQTNGFAIRHAATKNRNPMHAATPEERALITGFEHADSPEPIEAEITVDGKKYFKFVAPIYVERACLLCHGPKDKRPGFIIKKYPEDRAYGFAEGDLRGIVSVSFPLD